MLTVHEVSELTGVSIRTLQYYDRIGLLTPADVTEAGYRLYDDTSLEKLQQILFFRELEFTLKDIRRIVTSPAFDRDTALRQQIELLTLKKEHIEGLIAHARGILEQEKKNMSFEAFDKKKLDEYSEKARESWGDTDAYKEYEERSKDRTEEENMGLGKGLMDIFREFGGIRDKDPSSEEAQSLVRKLQEYITANYYSCTKEILSGLGKMYSSGGDFTANIDGAGGEGTAAFAASTIEIFCR